MVIITNANGDVVKNIPENIYQGSNNANSIVVLAPFASSSQLTIAYRLPDGVLTEPALMTPYEDVPSEYDLSGWYINLDEAITEKYGNVDFQVRATTNSDTVIASFGFNFTVLRGVAPILPPTPSQSIYEQILTALASIEADIVNGWLESKGLLPYDETFTYSLNTVLYDNNTFYKSKIPDNIANPLTDTNSWEEILFATEQEVADLIQAHNISETAHNDIRLILAGLIDGTYPIISCANVSETINNVLITEIFESDGKTAKTATNAINDASGNNIEETYQTKANLVSEFSATPLDTKYPSEKLVKEYVDESVTGAIIYKGLWDTSEQTDYSSLNSYRPIKSGWRYECTGTGCTIDTVEYLAGDFITFNVDIDAETTILTSMIDKTDNTDLVASVNGKKGIVVLDGVDIDATIDIDNVETTKTITEHLQRLEDIKENTVIWDGSIADSFAGGTGTEADPYLISNGSELAYLAQVCNSGTNATTGIYYKLGKDIILNKNSESYKNWQNTAPENEWVAIGLSDSGKRFAGVFDGDNYTIRGIYIDNSNEYQGLFGFCDGAQISNLKIDKSFVRGSNKVGLFAGQFVSYYGLLLNCEANGLVRGNTYLGGLIGYSISYITSCINNATVIGTTYVGGITSFNSSYTIKNCVNNGRLYGTHIGGIAYEISVGGKVISCVNNCNFTDISTVVIGGIVGRLSQSSSIINCENYGNITNSTENEFSSTGGICAYNSTGTSIIENSFNKGNLSDINGYVGGIGCSFGGGIIKNCYNTGTVYSELEFGFADIAEEAESSTIENCFYTGDYLIRFSDGSTITTNNSKFAISDQILDAPITIDSIEYDNLTDALNAWVSYYQNEYSSNLYWVKQGGAIGDRLPILTTKDTWVDLDKIEAEIALKVDKVAGKELSTNDFTDILKNKLDGIEAGAEVNVIETIEVNNVALTPTDKTVSFTVPTQASDIGALPDTTKYGSTIDLTYTASNGVLGLVLKDQDGTTLSAETVDLPMELIITSGSVGTCTVNNEPVAGYVVGDKYLDLVLANGEHIYILASDFIDQITITETGTGNAVTDISINGSVLTETKGKTFVETSRKVAGKALTEDITLSSSDLTDSANLIKGDTVYGGTIVDNLDTIEKSGFYTCYGAATGVPSSDYSWFVLHENSNAGVVSAKQTATAYLKAAIVEYVRVKTISSWGPWKKYEMTSNQVTSISESSTDTQYPTAKLVYDQLALKESKVLKFTNTSVLTSDFVADTTYTAYGYRASITLTGVLATDIPQVVLGVDEATSGTFAPISSAYAGGIYIYASEVPANTITIPTITIIKGV